MRNVYIMLSFSGTCFSRFLRRVSGIKYPHVSISLSKNLNTLYSFGRKRPRNPFIGGFVEEHQNKGVYGLFDSECEVLELPVEDKAYEELGSLINNIKNNRFDYTYNKRGLVFTYFHIARPLDFRFTCTQFVAWVLKNSKAVKFAKHESLVLPTDYYNISGVHSIYRGKFNKYCLQ